VTLAYAERECFAEESALDFTGTSALNFTGGSALDFTGASVLDFSQVHRRSIE
jgi:hypothetical protein